MGVFTDVNSSPSAVTQVSLFKGRISTLTEQILYSNRWLGSKSHNVSILKNAIRRTFLKFLELYKLGCIASLLCWLWSSTLCQFILNLLVFFSSAFLCKILKKLPFSCKICIPFTFHLQRSRILTSTWRGKPAKIYCKPYTTIYEQLKLVQFDYYLELMLPV